MSETDGGEGHLLVAHAAGEPGAFESLIKSFRAPVYSFLVRAGVDDAARDDLFQDIFLKVHRAAGSYDPGRPVAAWIFTIAANTVRDHFRRRKTREGVMSPAETPHLADPAPGPDRVASGRQALRWLTEALLRLPLPLREVVVLTCIEGMDQKAVSLALQIPVNTVKTHLRRARLQLARERLSRETREESAS